MEFSFLKKLDLIGRYHRLNPREKILLLGTAAILALFLIDLTIIKPLWNYHMELGERIHAQEKKLIRNILNINRKEQVEKEYDRYRNWIHPPSSDEEEIGKMLSEIEQKARSNDVTLVDMKPRETKAIHFYKEYSAELNTEMAIDSWVRFVHQIENLDQLILLTDIKLTYAGTEKKLAKAKMAFTKTLLLNEGK